MEDLVGLSEIDPLLGESDRGSVIVAAAVLDNLLARYLSLVMKKNGLSNRYSVKILDGNGALGSFSARAQIARGFSLISEDTFHDLMVIRKLRNEFAHVHMHCSFSDRKVMAQIQSMRFYQARNEHEREKGEILLGDLIGNSAHFKQVFCLIIKDIHISIFEAQCKYFNINFDHLGPWPK
jgi:mannitol operon repressor